MLVNPPGGREVIGGKAFYLRSLSAAFQVPPWFVVTFTSEQELDSPENQRELMEEVDRRGFVLMAVRSSATIEDSESGSFAGMFDTELGVQRSDLLHAIRKVLRSSSSTRSKEYLEALHGHQDEHLRMAVIVQELVRSRAAGVCLTRTHESIERMVIEACLGLGELLVSGRANADTFLLDRATLKVQTQHIRHQTIEGVFDADLGRVVERPVPFYLRSAPKLNNAEVRAVAEMALMIESQLHFEAADIEWCWGEDRLYALQSRPIVLQTVSQGV